MGSSLAILEGNCYLHSGEASWSKNFTQLGFPTGGIYQLMSKICNLQSNGIEYVVVFDSPSFRKSVNSDYKKSRKLDNKIISQANALIPCLKRAGVNVMRVPEFEGDDLVANIVNANKDKRITIYTCDYDLALNVNSHTTIVGCKSGFPSINSSNFSSVLREDRVIPYNAYGIYKVIFGCDSDQISSIGPDAERAWEVFMFLWKRDYDSQGKSLLITKTWCERFADIVANYISNDSLRKFKENIILVFPRILTEKEIADNNINLTEFGGVDVGALLDTCHLFGLKKCYRVLANSDDDYELEEEERKWLLKKAQNYKRGYDAIDSDISPNASVSYNGSNEVTEIDNVEEDTGYYYATNGLNIGEF